MSVKSRKEYLKQWAKDNPEKIKAAKRKYREANREKLNEKRRNKLYSISKEDFDKLKHEQNNCCAICGKSPTRSELDIDHCHITGAVRGLLCNNCNRGIGHLQDSLDILKNALTYLSKYQNKETDVKQ